MAHVLSAERINDELVQLGKKLVTQLFVLFKTSQNYSEGHGALDSPVANVFKLVREVQRRNQEASLRIKGRYLYLGDLRLKPDSAGFHSFGFVMDEMTAHGIGSICFQPSAAPEELRGFVYALREVDPQSGPEAYSKILERMQQRQITGIEVETLPEEAERVQFDREEFKVDKLKAKLLYQQAADATAQVMAYAAAEKPLWLRKSKRVVQQMIDLLASDEPSLIGLATFPGGEARFQNHAVNVCILSLALGRRVGMAKFTLCELGVAALFHDIGCAGPGETLEGKGELSAQEQLLLEAHPLVGVKKIMQLKGLDTLSSRIATGVFEHHLLADFSGYPRFPYRRLTLFGRIISIADGFDALTSSRMSASGPYPPGKAVRFLFTQAGKAYDQALLKLFLGVVGLYPIGSLLQLDSKELAVVVANSPEPAGWSQPQVKVIADSGGKEIDGEIVDLGHPACDRVIAGALDPDSHRLDLSRYFL